MSKNLNNNQEVLSKETKVTNEIQPIKQVRDKKEKNQNNKKKANANNAEKRTFGQKAKATVSELKKVTWPSFSQTLKQTGVVIGFVIIFILILLGLNSLFGWLFTLIVG